MRAVWCALVWWSRLGHTRRYFRFNPLVALAALPPVCHREIGGGCSGLPEYRKTRDNIPLPQSSRVPRTSGVPDDARSPAARPRGSRVSRCSGSPENAPDGRVGGYSGVPGYSRDRVVRSTGRVAPNTATSHILTGFEPTPGKGRPREGRSSPACGSFRAARRVGVGRGT